MESYIVTLEVLLRDNNVSECHGIDHALQVIKNATIAIESENYYITSEQIEMVLFASLLHDADDKKFFPENKNYENARKILEDKPQYYIDEVIKMISWVSTSKNGDNIPDETIGKEWMLIPRYADRLEAIGKIGIERCLQYTISIGRAFYTDKTERAKSEEDIWRIASIDRYIEYTRCGESESMIDHYYDKLLHITKFPIRNKYFDNEIEKRRKPMIDILLKYGEFGIMTSDDIKEVIS
jgi:uncharacterized protein